MSRVVGPGLFRLALATAVVLSHVSRLDVGRLAVMLFFFLSGYWVTKSWDEKFQSRDVLRFYAARYLRVVPLYLLAVLFAVLALHSSCDWRDLLLFSTAARVKNALMVGWSLDIELQFYALVPILGLASRGREGWLISLVATTTMIAWTTISGQGTTVLHYLPAFLLGMLAYRVDWRPSERQAWASLALFAATSVVIVLSPHLSPFIDKRVPDPFDRDIFAMFWMMPLLPYVARSLTVKSGKLDRHLGNVSYPVYLAHAPVIAFCILHLGQNYGKLTGVLATAFASVAVYLLIDRPLDAWRLRVVERSGFRRRVAVNP